MKLKEIYIDETILLLDPDETIANIIRGIQRLRPLKTYLQVYNFSNFLCSENSKSQIRYVQEIPLCFITFFF
jgi:hypothetical protein